MSNNDKIKSIATSFRVSLGFPQVLSKTGSELLFDSDLFTALFRERFGITSEYKDAFNAAFRDVTEGEGNEITKINSVISSALLPLLVFYKLYRPQKGESITLKIERETIKFNRAFFEVQNHVITPNRPSCVDVALVSEDEDTILFLESKLTEMFEDTTDHKEYGSSYKPLYEKPGIIRALKENGITIKGGSSSLVLLSEPQYLEGIKQTISHLIGLVRGPVEAKDQIDYISAYRKAKRFIYVPIRYDTSEVLKDQPDESSRFAALYSNVIGSHRNEIIKDIQEWVKNKWPKTNCDKMINIQSSMLTYQELIQDNPNWLDSKVKIYYGL
ncbi:MAG: hypothetical protein K2K00_00070 [Muribaculaceae bacterium]|nr:hypothetical protein [Muribaculaceae bacterium]